MFLLLPGMSFIVFASLYIAPGAPAMMVAGPSATDQDIAIVRASLGPDKLRELRREMQMIFQDPAASLEPCQTVGKSISIEEVFVINTDLSPQVRKEKTLELLEKVGLKREHDWSYPNTLSGGQKQRVGIARAIALDTKFVVLDESVSALDVSAQAQILQLLGDLSAEKHLTYFFITHDLGVVKHFCDRILVMYLRNVCEMAESRDLFHNPLHPYTQSLLAAVPRLKVGQEHSTESVLEAEPGHFVACHLFGAQK